MQQQEKEGLIVLGAVVGLSFGLIKLMDKTFNFRSNPNDNYYDIAYKTKSGRMMVAERVPAKTAKEAKIKLKKQMRASSTFDSIVTVVKL